MSHDTPISLRSASLWLLFAVAIGCFANSVFNGFVFDDTLIIRDNPLVRGGFDIPAIFSSNYWNNFPDRDTLYRPLAILSFSLEYAIFGSSPLLVHAVNIVLNGIVTVLLCLVLQAATGLPLFALAASLLWATMPLHCEVVANGVGRAELLAAFFSLCGFATYFQMVRGLPLLPREKLFFSSAAEELNESESSGWTLGAGQVRTGQDESDETPMPVEARSRTAVSGMALTCVFFFLSILSKESAVVWPALLLIFEWLLLEYGRPQRLLAAIPRYLSFAVPFLGYLVLRNSVVGMSPPQGHPLFAGGTALERVLFALETLLNYFHQFVAPSGFVADYSDYLNPPRPTLTQAGPVSTLFAWAAVAVLTAFAYHRGAMLPVAGVLWFLIAIFPTSNLAIAIGTIRADRLAYFPSIGLAICAGWALGQLAKMQRAVAPILLITLVAAQCYVSFFQNRVWFSKETLWEHNAELNPNSADAWLNMGGVYDEAGKLPDAISAYERSKMLKAKLGFTNNPASLALAKTYTRSGAIENAVQQYRDVLRVDPRHIISMLSLGQLLLRKEETAEQALDIFTQASLHYSQNFHVWAHRAEALRKLGRLDEALKNIDQALTLEQSWPYVWAIRSAILFQLGRKEEAQEADARAKHIPAKSARNDR